MAAPDALYLDAWIAKTLSEAGLARAVSSGDSLAEFRSSLTMLQARRLAETLRRASSASIHYRKVLPKAELMAQQLDRQARETGGTGAIKALREVLQALPYTFPDELSAGSEKFLALSHSEVAGAISLPSSGTTGAGKRIFSSKEDLDASSAFFEHGIRFMANPGDRVAMLMSGERTGGVGDLFSRGMARAGIDCRIFGLPVHEKDCLTELAAYRPACLVGLPEAVLCLARHPDSRRLGVGLQAVLLSADAVSPAVSEAIARALRVRVYRHYGMTEYGLAGAVECAKRAGCHPREADLYFEIIGPGDQAYIPEESHDMITPWGEIAVTTLTRRAMPLLRYRTGDEGRIIAAPCACGSALYRLEVKGRLKNALPGTRQGEDRPKLTLQDLDACLYPLPFICGFTVAARYADTALTRLKRLEFDIYLTAAAPAEALRTAQDRLEALVQACFGPVAPSLGLTARPFAPNRPMPSGKRVILHLQGL
jgi:phenylacetate-coenzyme A ligase PaaK-like adenylate-forming protein